MIAATQTPRTCEHGQLARQCEICDLQRELAATKALVKEWACEKCRTVYPGPPQKGFMCVICPSCNSNTMPHELLKHREELAAAKAEAAAMENNWMCAEEKASRREAEAEALREDAERWRMLFAFAEKYQLPMLQIINDVDAEIAARKG